MEPDNKPSKETLQQWHDDPKNWRAGVFYYNPEDKRIFPPKRVAGLGWTINFANKKLIIVFALILAVTLGIVICGAIVHQSIH